MMRREFGDSPDPSRPGVFERRARPHPAPTPGPRRMPRPDSPEGRHRKWFAGYADEHVLPLLNRTVDALKARGYNAHCRLARTGDEVTGELVIVPPGLPKSAPPPRFAVMPAAGSTGLVVEFTGTFPHAGPEGHFGGEIDYDTIYANQLEDRVQEFVAMAIGVD